MSKQLSVQQQDGTATIYCVLRVAEAGVDSGKFWNFNTSRFESMTGSPNEYALFLTHRGLGFYDVEVPDNLIANVYRVMFYLLEESQPRPGIDLLLKVCVLYWDGHRFNYRDWLCLPHVPPPPWDPVESSPKTLRIIAGDDYTDVTRLPKWQLAWNGPDLTGASCDLRLVNAQRYNRLGVSATADIEVTGTLHVVSDQLIEFTAPLTSTQTGPLSSVQDDEGRTHVYQIVAALAGKPITLEIGPTIVTQRIAPKD